MAMDHRSLPRHGKFSSTPNAYIVIFILIPGVKVMAVLSFAKNKFPKFLSLSNSTTPSAPGIFHTKYGSKETTTQKISKKITTLTIKTKIAN